MRKSMNAKVTSNVGECSLKITCSFLTLLFGMGFDQTLDLNPINSKHRTNLNQRTNGPVHAHLISWPSKAQNIHNLENIW